MEKKSMNSPDETRTFEKGKLDLTHLKIALQLDLFSKFWSVQYKNKVKAE